MTFIHLKIANLLAFDLAFYLAYLLAFHLVIDKSVVT